MLFFPLTIEGYILLTFSISEGQLLIILCENNIHFSIFNMYRSALLLLNAFTFTTFSQTPHFLFTSLQCVKKITINHTLTSSKSTEQFKYIYI